MTVTVMPSNPSLLVCYLEASLGRLELWLQDWRIATDVSNSKVVLFVKAARSVRHTRQVQFLGEPIECVEAAPYLGLTLDTQLTSSAHLNQVRKKAAQELGVLGPLRNRSSGLSVRNSVLIYRQLISPMMDYA
jgi:hypothetical protein